MNENEKTKIETIIICENLLCDRANEVDKRGFLYTEESLEKLDGLENIPIMLGIDFTKVIGKAKVSYVKGKGLLCTIEGIDRTLFEGKKIAPMYKVDKWEENDNVIVIHKCEIRGMAACENHSLDNIPSI